MLESVIERSFSLLSPADCDHLQGSRTTHLERTNRWVKVKGWSIVSYISLPLWPHRIREVFRMRLRAGWCFHAWVFGESRSLNVSCSSPSQSCSCFYDKAALRPALKKGWTFKLPLGDELQREDLACVFTTTFKYFSERSLADLVKDMIVLHCCWRLDLDILDSGRSLFSSCRSSAMWVGLSAARISVQSEKENEKDTVVFVWVRSFLIKKNKALSLGESAIARRWDLKSNTEHPLLSSKSRRAAVDWLPFRQLPSMKKTRFFLLSQPSR